MKYAYKANLIFASLRVLQCVKAYDNLESACSFKKKKKKVRICEKPIKLNIYLYIYILRHAQRNEFYLKFKQFRLILHVYFSIPSQSCKTIKRIIGDTYGKQCTHVLSEDVMNAWCLEN